MSATITYKGVAIATVDNQTKTLNTSGCYMEDDVTVTDVVQLKNFALRPDAEIVKTWSYNVSAVNDWSLTIPSYSTSAQTVKATSAASETYTLDYDNYDYYVTERMLSIPTYSISTKGKGRVEYWAGAYAYEVVQIPANSIHALVDTTKYYTSRNVTVSSVGAAYRSVYYSSGTAIGLYNNAVYSVVQTAVTPSISSGVLTMNTPNCTMRGSTSYFVNTYFNAITDIHYQWIAELWRVPKNNMNIDGWTSEQQLFHVIDCVDNTNHKLD